MKKTNLGIIVTIIMITTPAFAEDKLTLLLDWFVNPDHAPVIIAQQGGFFEQEGLQVEMVEPADPSAPPRLIAAKQGDIAISYQPTLYQQVEQGLPLVRIGTLVATPLSSLVVVKEGPIENISDLKGKKIGFSVSGFEDAMLQAMLGSVGLKFEDVELINVNFSLSPALLSGKVDAVVGAFRNFELTQIRLEGHEGRAFFPEEHGVPMYDELIYIVHKDSLKDERLLRFMRAVEQAVIFLTNHPNDAKELFFNAYPQLNDELNQTAWNDTLPRFAKRPAALDTGRYNRFAEFMKQSGLISKVESLENYALQLE